jgi:hypothetical protein
MKDHLSSKAMDLFSIQTVVGNRHLENELREIINQLAIIFLNYLEFANITHNHQKKEIDNVNTNNS